MSKSESPRRFGGLLPSSKSHDEVGLVGGPGTTTTNTTTTIVKKRNAATASDSPIRRSILEANEADDSSAAEDHDDKHKHKHRSSLTPKREHYGDVQVSVQYDTSRNKLVVKVNQARDLINTDKDSLSDPYARIVLLPDHKKRTKRKTKIVKNSLAPQWDETFEFDLFQNEAKTKTIDLLVKNDKSLFSREKTFMGECLIPLDSIADLENGSTEWYKLHDSSVFETIIKKIHD